MRVCAILLITLLASVASAADSDKELRISGIYSSLRYVEETGDLIGIEILVIPSWTAVVQVAEGDVPFIAVVELKPVGDHFEFAMPADSTLSHVRCEIRFLPTEAQLFGADCFDERALPRTKSYWE